MPSVFFVPNERKKKERRKKVFAMELYNLRHHMSIALMISTRLYTYVLYCTNDECIRTLRATTPYYSVVVKETKINVSIIKVFPLLK